MIATAPATSADPFNNSNNSNMSTSTTYKEQDAIQALMNIKTCKKEGNGVGGGVVVQLPSHMKHDLDNGNNNNNDNATKSKDPPGHASHSLDELMMNSIGTIPLSLEETLKKSNGSTTIPEDLLKNSIGTIDLPRSEGSAGLLMFAAAGASAAANTPAIGGKYQGGAFPTTVQAGPMNVFENRLTANAASGGGGGGGITSSAKGSPVDYTAMYASAYPQQRQQQQSPKRTARTTGRILPTAANRAFATSRAAAFASGHPQDAAAAARREATASYTSIANPDSAAAVGIMPTNAYGHNPFLHQAARVVTSDDDDDRNNQCSSGLVNNGDRMHQHINMESFNQIGAACDSSSSASSNTTSKSKKAKDATTKTKPVKTSKNAKGKPLKDRRPYPNPIVYVTKTDRDVMCGRGSGSTQHAGNIAFLEIVKQRQPAYQALAKKERSKKTAMAKDIVRQVQESGARFIQEHPEYPTRWIICHPTTAREKVSVALRQDYSAAHNEKKKELYHKKMISASLDSPSSPPLAPSPTGAI
mmetsp:Transcript_11273/g.32407  ORF Transcript_11273/g.32407 Transcript_11273/m.32407 type:complete len:529 (-) Transcript_11273:182-1768(-)|eukprot:CAMPEP_0119547192 /NCGR_PEP_ID=MMETSP1352-20130426/1378_1 /TAXON_ID=265584 /ORGANISM="Stauroneis constricta, Strain CCMP1120" /LENGTH=528 /DNA_ID=CAMNT_0007592049 /DNA_START=45 /DNA_END=1631 /DNA_ORIENTATION=-